MNNLQLPIEHSRSIEFGQVVAGGACPACPACPELVAGSEAEGTPEDARKDDYKLQIADCRFEIAQHRVGQSRRLKLRIHSCST
jgi:hypothetical protein